MILNTHKIKTKLLIAFSFLIVAAGIIGGVSYLYLKQITQYQTYRENVDQLLRYSLETKSLQKDFLNIDAKSVDYMRIGKSQTTTELNFVKQETNALMERLEADPITKVFGFEKKLEKIKETNQSFHQTFYILNEKVRYRGFKDVGVEGEMRTTAHNLEQISSFVNNGDVFDKLVLKLRRHEKDFMLRGDLMYVTKLHETARILSNTIPDSLENKAELMAMVGKYEQQFDKLVKIEKEIGLAETDGVRGELNEITKKIDREVASINGIVSKHTDKLVEQAQIIVGASILALILIAIAVSYYFTKRISAPIESLDRITQSVVKGLRNQEQLLDKIDSDDEVGNLAKNFKVMLTKLKSSIAEAEDRNLQLEEFAREEAKRNWSSEGLAIFGEILRNNNDNLERQSYEIISTLVRYTQSHQGALFIVNNQNPEQEVIELTAAYAYERQKFLKRTVEYGEGLVGSVWREQDTRLITDIPKGYANITSGLGNANPTCILLVPIKNDNNIEGVIELVSFKKYEQYEVEFIERLSGRIATTIAAVKANEQNAKLLAASKEFAEKLKLKEAELKRQIDNYEHWVQQFEEKLNSVAEEAHVYQTIINRVYEGIILTNEKFIITKVNNHILQRFGYKREELEGQSVDVLIETDYANIIDLKERKFQLSYKSFTQNVSGKVIDQTEHIYPVEMMSGKLEIDTKIVYVFLFNEMIPNKINLKKTDENPDNKENRRDNDFFSLMS